LERIKMRKIQSRKAISPVIATVILVAVAITVSVAVAYWMGGISSQYTQFEKVEIQTAYSVRTTGVGWNVTMEMKNTGSATSTLLRCFINEVPVPIGNYNATTFAGSNSVAVGFPYTGLTIDSGESLNIQVYVDEGYGALSSGTTINVKIHSAGGMDYIKLVTLV
jgi:flagellin-like protein